MANLSELYLAIEGMHCASCVGSIESATAALDGVDEVRVNLAMRSAAIVYDHTRQSPDSIIKTIKDSGYKATIGQPDIIAQNEKELKNTRADFYRALGLTVPLMIVAMLPMITGHVIISKIYDTLIQAVLAGIVLFYSGRSIIKDAFNRLRHAQVNMNSLIALGTLTAYGWSLFAFYKIYSGENELLYFESAAMIITLILLGRHLEAKAKGQAGEAIAALMKLTPSTAMAQINNVELEIEIGAVKTGMLLKVRPGERVPADGFIVEGMPHIDEAMLTGESLPVEKKVKDTVYGGSLNGTVPFTMQVTAAGEKTFLSAIIRLVSEAQSKKAPVQKLADSISSIFVPVVIAIALLTGLLWYLFDPSNPMLIKAVISVLIIACPCSLGLATPTAVLAGSGLAAHNGIIFRGGDIIEKVNNIQTVIFDKTGTLTSGTLEVVDQMTFGSLSQRNLLRIVGSTEQSSEHPVGKAIVARMQAEGLDSTVIKNMEALPGSGIKAECDGREIIIGNKALMDEYEVSFGAALLAAEKEMNKGRTVVFAAMDKNVVGLFSLADKIRSEAKDVISMLKAEGKQVRMLSGDNLKTVAGVASLIGILEYEAEVKPSRKKVMVESMRRAGFNVAMVGDGINDAPALAEADIGIAIGSGTDIAIESADVVLVKDDLNLIPRMFTVSFNTLKVIKQNLFWAFFYNVIAIPLAAGLFYPWFGWSLSPVIAALAMAFSSLFVVANSLRLNRLTLD